jgi:hypothetical protein
MDPRVQSFHPPFQDLGESCKTGYVAHRNLCLTQKVCRSTGRNNVDTLFFEGAREVGDASLVGNGNEGALNLHEKVEAMKG